MRLIIVQVLISSEVRSIKFIHIPMWDIIVSIYTQCSLLGFSVRLLLPHTIEDELPISLIVGYF